MDTVASAAEGGKVPLPAAALAGFVLAAAAARVAAGVLDAPSHTFAETRLMPLYQAARGLSPYAAPSAGPWYVPMYPPLSFLAYAPALLAGRPVAALRIAAAVAELCVIVPVALLVLAPGLRTAPRRSVAAAAAAALLCWLHASPVLTALFFVHADAPALLLAGVGAWLLVRGAAERGRPILLAASVAVLSLAPWAKQTFLPVLLLPAAVLWPSSRRRALLSLLGSAGATGLWAVLFGTLFGGRSLWFWTVAFSARQPWNGPPFEALANANRFLVAEALALLLVAIAFLWSERAAAGGWAPLAARPVSVLVLGAVLLWPGSVIGYVKVGGAVNSFVPTLFFLSCAAAVRLLDGAAVAGAVRVALVSAGIVLGAQSGLDAVAGVRHALRGTWDADFAFEAVRRDPAHVYVPWFPLSTHLATGAFPHAELGVSERALAGIPLEPGEWERFLPPDVRFVLCGKDACPATLARFQVTSTREVRRGETTWTAYGVRRP